MPRNPISELTPEQVEARRAYMREAKAKSRAKLGNGEDKRTAEDRREYFKEYRRKKRAEAKQKDS